MLHLREALDQGQITGKIEREEVKHPAGFETTAS